MTVRELPLAECADWYSGGTPNTSVEEYWGGDIPWVTSGSLTSFRLRSSDRRLTQLGVENGSRVVPPGAVLFVVRGMSLISEFRVGIAQRELAFGQDCKALIAKKGIRPEYLAYSIVGRSREVLGMVDQAAHGTGRLPTDLIGSLPIRVVPEAQQAAIVQVLSAFDDLIENNQRRIEILEETARLIYREWFVHLRFPGHEDVEWVESELGPVPARWQIRPLGDLVEIEKGLSYKGAHLTDNGLPMANLKCIDIDGGFRREGMQFYDGPFKARHAVEPGDVLIANTDLTQAANVIGRPALVPRAMFRDGGIYSHHLYRVRAHGNSPIGRLFAFETVASDRFTSYARSCASGTTVLGLRRDDVARYLTIVPPAQLVDEFEARVGPMHELADNLNDQIAILQQARDLLLPRLVSGELDVSELDLEPEAMG